MSTPTGRRKALEARLSEGYRNVCRYLGPSRRIAIYMLKQPEKDRNLGERPIAAAQEVPRLGYRWMSAWRVCSVNVTKLRSSFAELIRSDVSTKKD